MAAVAVELIVVFTARDIVVATAAPGRITTRTAINQVVAIVTE